MPIIETLPFILFVVVIATMIAERINVPYPLLLVVAGIIVGFIPGMPGWQLPSHFVLALFLPPILFSAARAISWRDARKNINTVGYLSILLVILTTFVIAALLHLAYPSLGFDTALVLGAIISPTDAVAATSILSRMNAKASLIRTIEVESLFNDAVGISLYKMAVMFVFLKSINPVTTAAVSLLTGASGILIGLLFSYFTNLIVEQFLSDSENDLPIIMSLVLAYVSYLFAEQVGASGILAVVTAGLFHKRTERIVNPRIRLTEASVWRTLVFFLNGLIFITIGNQFEFYLSKVAYIPIARLVYLAIITILGVLVLRFLWVVLTAYLIDLVAKLRNNYQEELRALDKSKIIIISWSGMRGLVSLALAVALPANLTSTQPFPHLNLIIFLTFIVILFTLLVQGLTLPILVKRLNVNRDDKHELQQTESIYKKLTKQAINKMEAIAKQSPTEFSAEAMKLVENYYTNRLLQFTVKLDSNRDAPEVISEAKKILGKILQQERHSLNSLQEQGEISEEVRLSIMRKLDRDEVGFSSYH